jgi:hypothetical protein
VYTNLRAGSSPHRTEYAWRRRLHAKQTCQQERQGNTAMPFTSEVRLVRQLALGAGRR